MQHLIILYTSNSFQGCRSVVVSLEGRLCSSIGMVISVCAQADPRAQVQANELSHQ